MTGEVSYSCVVDLESAMTLTATNSKQHRFSKEKRNGRHYRPHKIALVFAPLIWQEESTVDT